jgi:hypothetical protein
MPIDVKQRALDAQVAAAAATDQKRKDDIEKAKSALAASNVAAPPASSAGQRNTELQFNAPTPAIAQRDTTNDYVSRDDKVVEFGNQGVQQFPSSPTTDRIQEATRNIPGAQKVFDFASMSGVGVGAGVRAQLVDGIQFTFDLMTLGSREMQEEVNIGGRSLETSGQIGAGSFTQADPGVSSIDIKGLLNIEKEKTRTQRLGEKIEAFSEDVSKKLGSISDDYRAIYEDSIPGLSNVAEYSAAISSGFVSMGEALAVYIVTKSPNAAAAVLSSMDSTGDYKAAIDSGMSHREALKVYAQSASGTFIMERLGFEILFAKFGAGITSKIVLTGAKGSGEVATELGQTYWQNLVAQNSYDEARDIFDGTWETIVASAPVSFIAGGSSVYTDFDINSTKNAESRAINQIEKSGMTHEKAVATYQEMVKTATKTKENFKKTMNHRTKGLTAQESKASVDAQTKAEMKAGQTPSLFTEIESRLNGLAESTQVSRPHIPEGVFDDTLERDLRETPEDLIKLMERLLVTERGQEVIAELEVSEAGQRLVLDDEVVDIKSTFPQWIPKDLRTKKLLDKVMTQLLSGQVPTTKKARELYDIIFERISGQPTPTNVFIQTFDLDPETQQELRKTAGPGARVKGIPANTIGSKKITITEKAALKETIKQFIKGYKQGSKETKSELNILKTNMANLVQRLPLEKRGKFNKAIAKVSTPKGVQAIQERILKELKVVKRTKTVQDIKKLKVVKRTKTVQDIKKLVEKNKRAKKSGKKIDVESQKIIDMLIEGVDFTKPTKASLAKLEALKTYVLSLPEDSFLSPHIRKKLKRLTKKPLADMTQEELDQFKRLISDTLRSGELKYELDEFNKESERKRNVEAAVDALSKTAKKGIRRVKNVRDRIGVQLRLWNPVTGWFWKKTGQVARILDGKGKTTHQTHHKLMYAAAVDAEIKTQEDRQRLLDLGMEVNYGKWDEKKKAATKVHIALMEGHTSPADTLMGEYFKDGKLPELGEDQKRLIEGIQGIFAENLPMYSMVFEKLENKKFPKIPVYVQPMMYQTKDTLSSQDLALAQSQDVKGIKASSAIERLLKTSLTPRVDVLEIAMEGVENTNWYTYMEPQLRIYRKIFESKEYQSQVPLHVRDYHAEYIAVHARRGKPKNYATTLSWLRSNVTTSLLTGKITTVAVQPGAGGDAYAYLLMNYGQAAAMNYIDHFAKSWHGIPFTNNFTKRAIDSSKALQLRQGGDFQMRQVEDELVAGRFSGSKLARSRRLLNHSLMMPMKNVDIKTAAPVVTAMREWFSKKTDMTQEQIESEADYVMEMTSGSGNPSIRPIAFGQGGLLDLMTQLKTFAAARQDIIWGNLVKEGLIQGNLSQKSKAVQGLFIMMNTIMMENVVRWGIRFAILSAFGADDKAREIVEDLEFKKLLAMWGTAPFAEVLFVGDLVRAAALGFSPSLSSPLLDLTNRAMADLTIIFTAKNPESRIKATLRFSKYFALMTGVPFTNQGYEFLNAYLAGQEEKGGGNGGASFKSLFGSSSLKSQFGSKSLKSQFGSQF